MIIFKYLSLSKKKDIETFYLKLKNYNLLSEKDSIKVSDKDYENLVEEWVHLKDGSDLIGKISAKHRLLNFVKSRFSQIHKLDLSYLGLKTIPPLFKIKNLQALDLSSNQLTFCESTSFLANKKLTHLNLSNNKFSKFNSTSNIQSKSIVSLTLNNNLFTTITADYFEGLPNLKSLDLKNNNIHEFSGNISNHLPKLTNLELKSNQLQNFSWPPNWKNFLDVVLICNPIKIKECLDLTELSFTETHKNISFFVPIVIDHLGQVHSSVFQNETPTKHPRFSHYLSQLDNWVHTNDGTPLEQKKLARTRITIFISHPPLTIDDLDLSHLGLHTLPPLTLLHNLKNLKLNGNNLTRLELKNFPENSKIEKINLSINAFTALNESTLDKHHLSRLSELQYLNLASNYISEIDENIFEKWTNLEILMLQNNQLTYLAPSTWKNLQNLQILYLNINRLVRFEWPSDNTACPHINLTSNRLSLDTIATLSALQNSNDYYGPTYQFPLLIENAQPEAGIDLSSFKETLITWGIENPIPKWSFILNETSESKRTFYNNLNIFLTRLKNEVGRNTNGSIPKEVTDHVTTILSMIETYQFDTELITTIFNHALNAVTDCVDRIGVVLIWLSIYCQLYDAEKKGCSKTIKKFKKQLSTFDQVIKFAEDVNNCNIVFDKENNCFVHLSTEIPNGIWLPNENRVVQFNECSKNMKIDIFSILESKGRNLKIFFLHEQVEDVFLIINTLIEKKLSDIATISMFFGNLASLKNYLDAVIHYLQKNPEKES